MRQMINMLPAFMACQFNIYGLLFYMNDTKKITDILKAMNNKARICSVLTVLVATLSVIWTGTSFVCFLILEYIAILLWHIRRDEGILMPALRGIGCIIASIFTEISILFLYYHIDLKDMEYNGKIDARIKISCYLGIAIIQCALIILKEMKKMNTGYRLTLMVTLEIKTVGDLIWLYACVSTSAFSYSRLLIPMLFILEIFIDYHAFCIMLLKLEERSKREKREDIHANAYEYYLNMEEEHLRIRKMYHEMKNQLMIMKEGGTFSDEDQLKYGDQLQKKLETMNQFYHTGVPALDILLFDGKKKAEARNIEFEAVIEEGCLFFMEKEDINIIFSNAIINAIEACEKIKDAPRQIKIKAGKNLDDTLIYVKNTVSKTHEKGKLNTKKKNRIKHGIGLTSIQECVEKYNGYVSIIEEDETFQLAILFGKG